ncbi:MAG: glycosyltransferase family 4 protein [bacterium]|nr:glycosyltransferase family 4 protein [bacterium]
MDNKVLILHNIISPYKTLLFNELYKLYDKITVLYMAETEKNREWNINKDELQFPYEIMFKGALDNVNSLRLIIKTWERLNTINPKVIIIGGYSYITYWICFFWVKVNKKKIILWSASNEEDKNRLFLKEKIKSSFVKNCNAANVYGKRSKDYLAHLGLKENKIFITGNVTNNYFYYNQTINLRKKKEILCNQLKVPFHNFLYIGRFSKEKNLLFLLNAYKRLNDNNWGLILVGNGPQREEIEKYIADNSIKNIFLPGFKQKEEIPTFFAISDVFVLPSIYEPWGLVVNEAMAGELPVVVSRKCGCYPDIVKDGENGHSFDCFDKDKLYTLMRDIVKGEYDLRKMGECSLKIINNYTPENAAKVIIETINFVLKNNDQQNCQDSLVS